MCRNNLLSNPFQFIKNYLVKRFFTLKLPFLHFVNSQEYLVEYLNDEMLIPKLNPYSLDQCGLVSRPSARSTTCLASKLKNEKLKI